MVVAGPLSHQAARGLNSTRQAASVRIGCAAQARHTHTEAHRHQTAAAVCLAASGGLLAPSIKMGDTRRRVTAAHAAVNPGALTPGNDADVSRPVLLASTWCTAVVMVLELLFD